VPREEAPRRDQPDGTGAGERRRQSRRDVDRILLGVQRQLEAARRISEVLFESPHSEEAIERALDTAVAVVDADGGSILLARPETRELVFRHSMGSKPPPSGTAIPWDKGIAGHVYQTGEPVIVDDVTRDTRHFKGIDRASAFQTKDMIATPLKRWTGETIGVLEVLNKRGRRFDENDLQLLLIVSAISASAIERARLNEEAKLAEVAKLFGDISHDIKNLLTPVVYSTDALEELLAKIHARVPEAERAALERAYGNGLRLLGTMAVAAGRIQVRLKEFSDCIIGISTEPKFAPCRLSGIVQEVFAALGAPAEQQGISLRCRGLEELPEIAADDGRLFNAFYNLVNNALAAVPRGGSVTVAGDPDPEGGGVRLAIADTGRGMPPGVCATLFTALRTSRKRLGSGIGTRIVKDAVDAHGGRIEVASQVGVGTTFTIFLPLSPVPPKNG
jgi:signal transduction histidine kinase